MERKIETSLTILIVDDSESKIEKVKIYFNEVAPNTKVAIAKDRIMALRYLESEKFDLLLLDMQLPNRFGECEPDKNGGSLLLQELEIGENFKQPTRIIAFTEYEELQDDIRSSFPELGAIKFDISSNCWKSNLFRTLNSLSKSKSMSKRVIYCEGKNAQLYNLIGFPSIEFWELIDSRAIYYAAKNEKEKFALRDRDFLTSNEIRTLTNKPYFENYFILEYYCFENYIFHPENISELIKNFNKNTYMEDITKQKNDKIEAIIQDYKLSRLSYTDFTDNDKRNMDPNPENEIIASLKSDDFEVFYRFFDMAGKKDIGSKKSYNKQYLSQFNLKERDLVQTAWFRKKMELLFDKILIIS